MAKRLQWLFAFLTLIAGGIFVYAQNPVSISQIGTTPVTTTIPVSGTFWQATQPVSGTFWQATQPISAASLPLPTGAATETTLGTRLADATYTGRMPAGASPADAESTTNTSLSRIGGFNFLYNGTTWDRQRGDTTNGAFVNVKTSVLPTGAATETTLGGVLTTSDFDSKAGSLTETAPATDTASSGLNGRLQRIAQRLTTLLAVFPTTLTLNSGAADASTLRTATDLVRIGGVAITTGAGATGTGVARTNDVASSATGAAPPASAAYISGLASGATGGLLLGITVCDTPKAVNISTATTTLIVTGVSGRHVRICSWDLLTAAANNVAWLSGTGATCGTGTAGMAGGTTAASGYNFAANGGATKGSGLGEVLRTVATGDSVCLITSAATQLSGSLYYAIY